MTSLEDNARDTRLLNYTIEEVAIFQYPPPKKYYLVIHVTILKMVIQQLIINSKF